MKMNRRSAFLVDQARRYNSIDFIASDPISIPHRYDRKEDVEIVVCARRSSVGKKGSDHPKRNGVDAARTTVRMNLCAGFEAVLPLDFRTEPSKTVIQ